MSFSSYSSYQASSTAWIDQIPGHWNETRLKNVFALMKRSPEEGDEIVTAFRDGEVTLRSNRRTEGFTNAVQEHGYQRVVAGDLVIHAMDAFAGAIGVSDSTGKSTPVYSVCRLKHTEFDVRYFGRLLRHMALSGYINSLAKGIRERSTEFRWNEAANITVPIPPSNEQHAISDFLDRETAKIDALVAEQRRLIELLKEKRQAVISHAVTKGLDPNAKMKPSGIEWLGDVPEHWQVVPIKRLMQVKDGTHATPAYVDQSEIAFPLITSKDFVNSGIDFESARYISEADHREILRRSNTEQGDVLMSMIGGNIGKAVLVQTSREFSIKNVALFKTAGRSDLASYLLYYLQSGLLDIQIDLLSRGGAQGFLGLEDTRRLVICALPPVELENTVRFLDHSIAKIDLLISESHKSEIMLQERRTALISAAVTGKIDVRHLASQEAA